MAETTVRDITAVFRGVTTPISELTRQIQNQGWNLDKVTHGDKGYAAKAINDHGDSLERTAFDENTAVANLLIAIVRRNYMRTKAQFKVGQWQTTFTDQLQQIADAYAKAPVYDPKAAGAWKELADDSVRRAAILGEQLQIEVVDDPEPYANAQEMCEDVHTNQHFYVSRANSEHPVWTLDQNVAFRTVHDILGHCVSGGDFGWQGENLACAAHFPLLSPNAQRALFTECIAQTGYAAYYRGFGPQKVAFLDEFLDQAQQKENPAAHQGIHPSQSLAPTAMPTVPGSPSADTPHQPGAIAPHQEALGLTPVFTKQAAGEMVDPNWKWDSGIDPNPDHQAPLHYGDPLEYPKVNDTAAKIDTGWSSMDESDPGQRAMMRQAIVNAFRAVLLSPRKDLRWNAAHYQDISHIPAEVDDPKIYWDALEHKRRQHNQARGRHPDAHLIYYKPRQRYYQLVQMMNPDLSHDEAITKADKAIFQMRLHETERLEEEDAQKSPDKHRSGDEIERRVNESIAKRLKQIVDEAYDPKTDVAEQEQQTLFSGNRKNEQYDIFTGEPAEFYGAWMGTHLKAIAEISRHADELLDAAIQDVRQHDGTGHLFRTKVLQLGIPGAGPKVASFAWLLLQPMTSQLGTIDTHMMDVLGRPYEKEMNNRDYFKFERELQAGRDAAGYGNVPLGQFQWGLWDYKRTGPGSHQDHSALRVLDPTPHNDIDWAQKAQNLKADSWLKQAPEWWQATQDARDQVAQHWDDTMARTVPATNYPFATLPQVMSAEAEVPIAQNSRMQRLKEQHGLTTEEIWALDPDEDEQGEQVKVEA